MGGYWAVQSYRVARLETESFRAQIIESEKTRLRQEVACTTSFIAFKRSQTEARVRSVVRDRVYEAHALASHIYETYKDKRSLDEIKDMVREALRPIRFNNGRGYYFAARMDGVEQLFADRPELEGKDLLGLRDTQGKYVIRDMIELVREKGEGYYSYRWTKPESPGLDFVKESYIKYFEPFDWFIGTGEYLEDMEQEIRSEVLAWVASQNSSQGYIFVQDASGVLLVHIDPTLVGKNQLTIDDPERVRLTVALMKAASEGGGFVEYDFQKPGSGVVVPKISYADGFEPWGWLIGKGVYLDDLGGVIARRTAALEARLGVDILRIVFFALAAAGLALFVSYRFSGKLRREFSVFSRFFAEADRNGAQIETERLSLSELRALGLAANRMVERQCEAEEAAHKGEQARMRLITIVEQMAEGVAIGDLEGNVEYVNPAYERMSGFTLEQLKGKDLRDALASAGIVEEAEEAREAALAGKTWSGRVEATRSDGQRSVQDVAVSPLRDAQGRIVNLLAVERDVTEMVELENDLRQAQKMEAVGQLAGGIAHDFNNLLQVILGHVDLALDEVDSASRAHGDLTQIQVAGKRASGLVRQLLTFSRRETIQLETLDLNEVIDGLMKMLGRLIGEHIELSVAQAPEMPLVSADRGQMEQILLNLCVNARDAMPHGGRLDIRTRGVYLEAGAPELEPDASPGEYVLLTVADTGKGIPEEALEHVFEPFFTTKGVGEGTGLGLSTVYGIVRRHEGFVSIESAPDAGSTFRVYLPATEVASDGASRSESDQEVHVAGGSETILVAEDDDNVRTLTCQVLERAGYRVLLARDGREALDVFEEQPDRVDLALLDVVMPRMGGREVYEAVHNRRPEVCVVFATGYSGGALNMKSMKAPNVRLIQKPYRAVDLLSVVRQVLSETRHGVV